MRKKDFILTIVAAILIVATYMVLCTYKNYIEIKDGKQNLNLFQGLISYLLENNTVIMDEADYIAVDASSFHIISEQEKNKLINFLRNYNANIIIGPFSLLNNSDFMNEDGSLKGVFISASNIEIVANKLSCEYSAYKAPLNIVGYDVKATYTSNRWKVKYQSFIS